MNDSKIEIIKKAINGDRISMIKLIKEEENNIYTTLYYLNKNNDEIVDIVQDVLIKLSNKIGQLRNPKYFKTWLNQIVINSYYDYLRKSRKNKLMTVFNNDNKFDIADHRADPQDSVLYSELDSIIKNSIENLPIHYRIPITLREVQGLSYDDISNITKTSVGTVKSRISRARNIIQDKVRKYEKS